MQTATLLDAPNAIDYKTDVPGNTGIVPPNVPGSQLPSMPHKFPWKWVAIGLGGFVLGALFFKK